MKLPPTASKNRDAVETSVTFSLQELSRLEQDRVREEDLRRARLCEERTRQERLAAARRGAAEQMRAAAESDARGRRLREDAEDKARAEARACAVLEVARIEAESRARLEEENVARAHELAVLRARSERTGRRVQQILGVALAMAFCGGSATAYVLTTQVAALEQEAERLRERQVSMAHEREQAVVAELAALDRRFAALHGRAEAVAADEARAVAATRQQILPPRIDSQMLRAFADAVDALTLRLQLTDRREHLDRRRADLEAWAAKQRRSEILAPVRGVAARAANEGATESILRAYEQALDGARAALSSGSVTAARSLGGKEVALPRCTNPHDPLCGLDGQPLLR